MVHPTDPQAILANPWPYDLKPVDVPFLQRTRTVLERHGLFDGPIIFNTLTAAEVAEWCNAGPVTINDLRTTGNRAIHIHHAQTETRHQLNTVMGEVAAEPWSRHIWSADPRFTEHLPATRTAVHDITTFRQQH